MGDLQPLPIPVDAAERAVYFQERMTMIAKAIPVPFNEVALRELYLLLCRWDSARVERDKALAFASHAPPMPAHVAELAHILLP